jgi:membrane protein DedA with SNARE-associated domain/rhodanese-related sulfurtransferase
MLFALVFAEVIGVPIPAALALIAAGALAATGALSVGLCLLTAVGAMLVGDTLMYLLGRSTGWWLLGLICRLSLHPDSCILRSADAFFKKGRMVLVFSRFVPGINTLAAPLAGSMNMPIPIFYAFDLAGACLYTGAYFAVGYLLSGFTGVIERGYHIMGNYAGWAIGIGASGYLVYRVWDRYRKRPTGPVARVRADDLGRRLSSIAIFDVRSHGYYDKNTRRIQGSVRLDPHLLGAELPDFPVDKQLILYCTCQGEATSSRAARFLAERGIQAYVLTGGLRAWRKAGLPLEPVPEHEMLALPTFS